MQTAREGPFTKRDENVNGEVRGISKTSPAPIFIVQYGKSSRDRSPSLSSEREIKPSNKLAGFLSKKVPPQTDSFYVESAEGERRKHFGPGNKLWGVERTEKRASESEWSEIAFSLVKSSSERRTDGRRPRRCRRSEASHSSFRTRFRCFKRPPTEPPLSPQSSHARAHTRQGRATAEIEHADRRTTALLVPRVES